MYIDYGRSRTVTIVKLKLDGSEYIDNIDYHSYGRLNTFYVKDGWIYMVADSGIKKVKLDGSASQDILVAQRKKYFDRVRW